MRLSGRALPILLLALLAVFAHAIVAEAATGRVRGVVSDESGGVLPGVTVVATAQDGRVLATAVTDAAGSYIFTALPTVRVTLTFQLEAFSTAVVELLIAAETDASASPRLTVAPRSETVVVHGATPVDVERPRPSPPPPPPPPPPAPVVLPVPDHDRDSVCGPAKAGRVAESFGTIRSRRRASQDTLYAEGDELVINGGTDSGIEVGRNFVVRRIYRAGGPQGATAEHSAGLLQIVEATERTSVAVVVYACDELMQGDALAAFNPEPIRAPEPLGTPAYDNAARVLFGDLGQSLGVPRRLMVIDRGRDNGLQAGQRLTLFRRQRSGPSVVGEAVVVAVRFDSATIRVVRAIDAITSGDWAAPQRY